jgi:AcrR family transcriptional regulator
MDAALALADRRAQVGPAPYAYAVAHVDMAQVAEAAGVSRSALYRLWDTQDAFRADLAAHLAATDDAPWLAIDAERLGGASVPPDAFRELTRRLLAEGQDQLASDAQPLLRAGFAGYPNAREVTGVIGEREGWRLLGHAELVERALAAAGRRCVDGVRPLDLAVATACVAEGLALAAHMTPPDQHLAVGCDPARPWSLLAAAACLLFEGLSEPDPGADRRGGAAAARPAAAPPPPPRPPLPVRPEALEPTGRRRYYLDLAARLAGRRPGPDPGSPEPGAGAEGAGTDRPDGTGLGYVSLDVLARAEGVTRGAVRKLWPTEASFGLDMFAHLLGRHRAAVAGRLAAVSAAPTPPASASEAGWLRAGDDLLAHARSEGARLSHLTFAPRFVLPSFRSRAQRHAGAVGDRVAVALVDLLEAGGRRLPAGVPARGLAVLVLALVDGTTRVFRTVPELVRRDVAWRDGHHSLLGISLATLLGGLSRRSGPRSVHHSPTTGGKP